MVFRGGGIFKVFILEFFFLEEDKDGSDLRFVVIDGSNVVMRYVLFVWLRSWLAVGNGGFVCLSVWSSGF